MYRSTLQELRHDFAALGVASDVITDENTDLNTIDISSFPSEVKNQKKSVIPSDSPRLSKLLSRCCGAYAINLLLQIKFYLKELYVLDNEKCQTYQPSSTKVSVLFLLFSPTY